MSTRDKGNGIWEDTLINRTKEGVEASRGSEIYLDLNNSGIIYQIFDCGKRGDENVAFPSNSSAKQRQRRMWFSP